MGGGGGLKREGLKLATNYEFQRFIVIYFISLFKKISEFFHEKLSKTKLKIFAKLTRIRFEDEDFSASSHCTKYENS